MATSETPMQTDHVIVLSADRSNVVDCGVQVNTIELRQRSKPIHNIRAAREGVGQAELEFDALKQFMDGASGIIPAIFLPDSGSKPRTPGGTVRPVAPDTKRPGGTPGSTPVRLSRLLKVRQSTPTRGGGTIRLGDPSPPGQVGVYRTESAQYGAEGQPLYTAEQIRTILEKLALSPRALSGSWRANAGWQPRYGHWRMPSDTSPRTVLAAVPRQLKPLIERATQGAHEAEAGVLSSLVPDLAPQMEGVLPPLPGSPGGSGTMLNL